MPHDPYHIELFVWEEGAKTYAMTKPMMEDRNVPVQKEGSIVPEPMIDHLPEGGAWHHIFLKENFYREDRQKAESSLHVLNPKTRQVEYQSHRLYDAFAAQAISSWDFRQEAPPQDIMPISEYSIGRLKDRVATILVEVIWVVYNDDPDTFFRVHGQPTS